MGGSHGSVFRAKRRQAGEVYAVKTIVKAKKENQERGTKAVKREIDIMRSIDHPNIVKLYVTFEDHRNVYLVMELCGGGALSSWLSGKLVESEAAVLMEQILRAVDYLHGIRVCHRDLKPENVLFASTQPIMDNVLKLVDFGFACQFSPDLALCERVGSPGYAAPQVLTGRYDQMCDMWSCGVIMYLLLSGRLPFCAETSSGVQRRVYDGHFGFEISCWDDVSEDAKALICSLLMMDPDERCTAAQALGQQWLKNGGRGRSSTIESRTFATCCETGRGWLPTDWICCGHAQ